MTVWELETAFKDTAEEVENVEPIDDPDCDRSREATSVTAILFLDLGTKLKPKTEPYPDLTAFLSTGEFPPGSKERLSLMGEASPIFPFDAVGSTASLGFSCFPLAAALTVGLGIRELMTPGLERVESRVGRGEGVREFEMDGVEFVLLLGVLGVLT
jgi:hypothetical protein